MKFTESHEWIKVEGNIGTVGVTDHAQKELGEIVYVELPNIDAIIKGEEEAVVLESTKAAADVYSPISGKVTAVNENLSDSPDLVNQSPEGEGWLYKIELINPEEIKKLMDEADYRKMLE